MPKKATHDHRLREVRKATGMAIPDFARSLGVSASLIKKVENGQKPLTQELAGRIFLATGVVFLRLPIPEPFEWGWPYTKEDYKNWQQQIPQSPLLAEAVAAVVQKWLKILLLAAARPGVGKVMQIFCAITQALETIKSEFQMEKHIYADLRDRYATDTKNYTYGQLRGNSLLAQMLDFKDDPDRSDDEQIALTKPNGWIPTKEYFNLWWDMIQELQLIDQTQPVGPDGEMLLEAQATKTVEKFGKNLDNLMDEIVPDTFLAQHI